MRDIESKGPRDQGDTDPAPGEVDEKRGRYGRGQNQDERAGMGHEQPSINASGRDDHDDVGGTRPTGAG
ncbi:hypothetical protein [Streptomyces sp. NPDC059459]|uniref:hypothetical protein n=1 Tax=unclassified Streptomyces TaxID=2593676 RepID=UPI0036A3AB61